MKICKYCKHRKQFLEPIAPGECMLQNWCNELKMKISEEQTCPKFEKDE